MSDDIENIIMNSIIQALKDSGRENIDVKEFENIVKKLYPELIKDYSNLLLKELKYNSHEMLKEYEYIRMELWSRRNWRWLKPLEILEMLIVICLESGSSFSYENRNKSKKRDFVFEVLTRMHGRACRMSFEILSLLKNGFPDGAFARWRSLYELSIISLFIKQKGQNVAKRFIEHGKYIEYRDAKVYQKHCKKLGYCPYSRKQMKSKYNRYYKAKRKYGKYFLSDYGWASEELNKGKCNFSDIEKEVKMDHFKPFYKMACHKIHTGPISIYQSLGQISGNPKANIILAGPSNYGLADPGQNTAISLSQITINLLLYQPTTMNVVTSNILHEIIEEIGQSFVEIQKSIEIEENEMIESVLEDLAPN